MLILIAFVYVCGASGLVWLVVFPAGRGRIARALTGVRQLAGRRAGAWRHAGGQAVDAARASFTLTVRERVVQALVRHRVLLAIAAPAILVPPLLALALSNPAMLPVHESHVALPDAQVAALLAGEQLAPPVALPPDVFTTREVELVRPMLVGASRNWGMLHPDFSSRLLLAFKIMREQHGYEMALLEGYRSPERQEALAGQGGHVTNARAFQSWHQYGLAADCAFLRDGKLVISEKDPWAMRGYQLYGEVTEQLGMTWGGRWKMMDFGHTELRMRGVMKG